MLTIKLSQANCQLLLAKELNLYGTNFHLLFFFLAYQETFLSPLTSGEGIVTLYAVPNPFLLNKISLNQTSLS